MKILKTTLAATLAISLAAAPAVADTPGKDWMPVDQVLTKLTEAGYGSVRSIEADDGLWKAKASRDGRNVKVQLDPHSGVIVEKAGKTSDD